MKFKHGDTVIYPQHGACIVEGVEKKTAFGEKRDYLILRSVIGEMKLSVPVDKAEEVGVRPPVKAEELDDLVAVLAKPDPPRAVELVPLKEPPGEAEVGRRVPGGRGGAEPGARNRDAALSAAERTMYERARINLVSEIAPALHVSNEEAEAYLDDALAQGVLRSPGRRPRRRD